MPNLELHLFELKRYFIDGYFIEKVCFTKNTTKTVKNTFHGKYIELLLHCQSKVIDHNKQSN